MSSKIGSKHRDPSPRKQGGRLARRAKSFKEDVMGKINQIRNTPAGSGRSVSPHKPSPKSKPKPKDLGITNSSTLPRDKKPTPQKELEVMLVSREKLLKTALRYFKDVVDKDKLEMLPGCATEVLESVLAIHTDLKKCLISEESSVLTSASNKVFQSLANLIRWSDNLVIHSNKNQNTETVSEIVQSVQDSVQALINLVIEKIQTKALKTNAANGSYQSKPESPSSPSPLPDIPLTPREREILEQTSFFPCEPSYALNHSASSDSILNSTNHSFPVGPSNALDSGPPKPPLPICKQSSINSMRPLSCGDDSKNINFDGSFYKPDQSSSSSAAAPPLPPKRRSSARVPCNSQLSFTDSCSSGQMQYNSSTPSPPPDMAASFYDNADESGFSNSFSDFRSELCKSDLSYNSDWSNNRSPDSASSISKSPTSSLDSILDKSTEDVLMSVSKSASASFYPMDPHMDIMGKSSMSVTSISKSSRQYKFSSYSSSNSSKLANEEMCLQMSSSSTSSHRSSGSMHEQVFLHQNPPALPLKQRKSTGSNHSRAPSQYDNVPDLILPTLDKRNSEEDFVQMRSHHGVSPQPFVMSKEYQFHSSKSNKSVVDGYVHSNNTSHSSSSSSSIVSCPVHGQTSENKPPPLPPKRKNIMAYMQMLGKYSCPNESEFYRHSVHTYNLVQAQIQQHQTEQRCYTMYNSGMWSMNSFNKDSVFVDRPPSFGPSRSVDKDLGSFEFSSPPMLPPKKNRHSTSSLGRPKRLSSPTTPTSPYHPDQNRDKIISAPMKELSISRQDSSTQLPETDVGEESILDKLDVDDYLVYKTNPNEDGPDIRGGPIDALVVHAAKCGRGHFELIYEQAFLATYRTFILTKELVDKLLYRYNRFIGVSNLQHQRAARNAFSLLVRVVDDMCVGDVESGLINNLTEFISQLVSKGELTLAKALREKVMEKCDARQHAKNYNSLLLPSMAISTRPASLLDFKAKHMAKQMTMMDAELFHRIEIPEVLLWAKEQSEELSPNLTTFTEHFNKMSYWARSRILEQDEAKEREKYVLKFINIMKHLRMLNNFNSYLAILSALDSAPIRRLEWQKDITEGLKEYCQLIDSSSSFRAYRQALAETEPPCIPYIGLILQDLTFVHIGNNDVLPDNNINFAKRWQQYNILDNMSRFKKCLYKFKKNDRILAFFNNFDHYLCEEAMWQISESIKPRGGKKKVSEQS